MFTVDSPAGHRTVRVGVFAAFAAVTVARAAPCCSHNGTPRTAPAGYVGLQRLLNIPQTG